MRILYSRSHSIGSMLIRAATMSAWSHCAIVTPDDTVIESRALAGGVVERPLNDAIYDASRHAFSDIAAPDDAAGIAWARTQIGKPYDWAAVTGIALRRKWHHELAWFCSELVEAALSAAGLQRFRSDLWRVTPGDSWMLQP